MTKSETFLKSNDGTSLSVMSSKIRNQNLKISDQNGKIIELEKTKEKILNKDNETLEEEFSNSKQLLTLQRPNPNDLQLSRSKSIYASSPNDYRGLLHI